MHTEFDRAVDLAFGQIRHYGAGNPVVVKRLSDALTALAEVAPQQRRPTLVSLAGDIRRSD